MSVTVKSVVLVSVLTLAACAENAAGPDAPAAGGDTPAPVAAEAPQPDTAAPAPPAPAPRPRETATPAAQDTTAATAVAPAATVRRFPDLVGRTGVQVRAAMGAPDGISERPPAVVWRYELSGCSLDLFLFPDVSSGAEKALTWSALPKEPDPSTDIDPRCAEVTADG